MRTTIEVPLFDNADKAFKLTLDDEDESVKIQSPVSMQNKVPLARLTDAVERLNAINQSE